MAVANEDLVVAEGAPKVDGWIVLLQENLRKSGAWLHTLGYGRRVGYQNGDEKNRSPRAPRRC